MTNWQNSAEAFSRKAAVYDAFGEGHENLTRMRQRVYDHICAVMPPGGYLLELNAGTGLDAVNLAARGFRIHATDIAPGMVAEIERKIGRGEGNGRITSQLCSFTKLEKVTGGPFDGIYSNFGGLNCIDDLTAVTRHLSRLLKPGGIVTVVIMPRICPWEMALLLKDWRVAARRLSGQVTANVEGVPVATTYFSPRQTRRAFGPAFRPIRQEALSLITPTADNKSLARNHPRLYGRLVRWDERLSRWPVLRGWGDFFVMSLKFGD
ncbi:MAG TPA: class I SAM-dependent methyltransferase [Anaerolineae bacterium]|nr:class I SAM-dependent methyltransferase [Anaerolineae bacterium]